MKEIITNRKCVSCGEDISGKKMSAIVCSPTCYTKHWNRLHGAKQRAERKEYRKQWAKDHVEHLKAYRSKYYQTNREAMRCRFSQYYKENSEKVKKQVALWREANIESVKRSEKRRIDQNIEMFIWKSARSRATKKNIPFNIEVADIVVPEFCPVLGIKIKRGIGKPSKGSPSLDRFIPELGYVKGNVAVISHRANMIKTNACIEEIMCVLSWMEETQSEMLK